MVDIHGDITYYDDEEPGAHNLSSEWRRAFELVIAWDLTLASPNDSILDLKAAHP